MGALAKTERCAVCDTVMAKNGLHRHLSSKAHLANAAVPKKDAMPCVTCKFCQEEVEAREWPRHMRQSHPKDFSFSDAVDQANIAIRAWNKKHPTKTRGEL